jgi:hypothetical protein
VAPFAGLVESASRHTPCAAVSRLRVGTIPLGGFAAFARDSPAVPRSPLLWHGLLTVPPTIEGQPNESKPCASPGEFDPSRQLSQLAEGGMPEWICSSRPRFFGPPPIHALGGMPPTDVWRHQWIAKPANLLATPPPPRPFGLLKGEKCEFCSRFL